MRRFSLVFVLKIVAILVLASMLSHHTKVLAGLSTVELIGLGCAVALLLVL